MARLLQAGAEAYVCGDGIRMAPGVGEASQAMYLKRTPGAQDADADEWLQQLIARGCS
ncbi:hypothetical protein [Streptomyces sp. Tue6028]|uniref:hypothetical protein n=1 Tax=Streptomyces sp. Tue6028 TaxID=2036037 RepID=UPI003EBE2CD1